MTMLRDLSLLLLSQYQASICAVDRISHLILYLVRHSKVTSMTGPSCIANIHLITHLSQISWLKMSMICIDYQDIMKSQGKWALTALCLGFEDQMR